MIDTDAIRAASNPDTTQWGPLAAIGGDGWAWTPIIHEMCDEIDRLREAVQEEA